MNTPTLLRRFSKDFDPKWLRLLHAKLKPRDSKRREVARIATSLEKGIRGWTSQYALNNKRRNRTPHECLATWLEESYRSMYRLFHSAIAWEKRIAVIRKRTIAVAARLCKAERNPVDDWLTSDVVDLVNSNAPRGIISDALMDAGCDDAKLLSDLNEGKLPDRLVQAAKQARKEMVAYGS